MIRRSASNRVTAEPGRGGIFGFDSGPVKAAFQDSIVVEGCRVVNQGTAERARGSRPLAPGAGLA